MHVGPTLIEVEGAEIAERVFAGWAALFALGPTELKLTGSYSWGDEEDSPVGGERVTQLAGGYDQLKFNRDEVVAVLWQLAAWCSQVRQGSGRLYLDHGGV